MVMPYVRRAKWTLAQMHRLPDDGNRYELVHGELLVTPAPSYGHQAIVNALAARLQPYVQAEGLGRLHFPRSVVRADGSEVEPDLMVRPIPPIAPRDWDDAPVPILVAEVLSPSSRRGDGIVKRGFYLELDIPAYWIFDGDERSVRVVWPDHEDVVLSQTLSWHPVGVAAAPTIDLVDLFAEALGPVV